VASGDYDLVVLGALGLGKVRDSQIGSVCERVTRACDRDVLVIKQLPNGKPEGDTILVGIDGSPQSFGALMAAVELASKFGKQVELIAVYDPYLHYAVFNGVVNVLTEKAAKVFRFEEQNQLHEEIIDTGLAQIYQSHLDVGARMAQEHGCEVKKTLLDGKAFQKVLDHVRKTEPWLLVLGRTGIHSGPEETGLGSNTENLLRSAPCDLLLTTRKVQPELDVRADESIRWTEEAEARMTRVPPQVKGIARTAILRLAVEKGHSVITSNLLDEAMDRFMPKSAAERTAKLAEAIAFEAARSRPVSMCKRCGCTALEPEPKLCTVCQGTSFDVITPEVITAIEAAEGGAQEEATYDGKKLRWTEEAKKALWTLKEPYQRRRTKARVEKSARLKKLPTVTLEFAKRVIEEETGVPLLVDPAATAPEPEPIAADGGKKLVARDAKNVPLLSVFDWTDDAAQRILRVPSGFMRDRTQARIEELGHERGLRSVDLALVEEGIEHGRQMMQEMLKSQGVGVPGAALHEVPSPAAYVGQRSAHARE
jgi:nucleotide-binding universal stress UspA family protein